MDGHNPPGPVALGMENARLRAQLAGLRKVLRNIEAAADLPTPAPQAWNNYNRAARVRLYEIRTLLKSIRAAEWPPTTVELAAAAAAFDKLAKSDRGYLTADDAYKAWADLANAAPALDDGAAEVLGELRAAVKARNDEVTAAKEQLRAAGIPLDDDGADAREEPIP